MNGDIQYHMHIFEILNPHLEDTLPVGLFFWFYIYAPST